MSQFIDELRRRLDEIQAQGLYRELRRVDSAQGPRLEIEGRTFLNFSSNDYLGLANHPALKAAATEAIAKFGAGSGASRLICGSLAPHHELEAALAAFKQTESALAFSSGYAAACGAITAVAGKDDAIVLDKLVHASIVDAARLSGAKLRVFAHNNLNELEDILRWADQRQNPAATPRPRTLIITESVFSMDGDLAPLREIAALKDKHGAWLMVDEAHATGLFGPNRRGLAEELGVSKRIEIQLGTLGKALGSAGGFICGPRALSDLLVNRARSFIFSTAPVPAAAAAAKAGVEVVQSAEGRQRRDRLFSLIEQLCSALPSERGSVTRSTHDPSDSHGISTPSAPAARSAIIPIIIGAEDRAMETAAALRAAGIFVPAIRFPSVPRGQARLRITLTADHAPSDIQQLLAALDGVFEIQKSKIKNVEPRPSRS